MAASSSSTSSNTSERSLPGCLEDVLSLMYKHPKYVKYLPHLGPEYLLDYSVADMLATTPSVGGIVFNTSADLVRGANSSNMNAILLKSGTMMLTNLDLDDNVKVRNTRLQYVIMYELA